LLNHDSLGGSGLYSRLIQKLGRIGVSIALILIVVFAALNEAEVSRNVASPVGAHLPVVALLALQLVSSILKAYHG
jgi:uncharacterized integral membrane protein